MGVRDPDDLKQLQKFTSLRKLTFTRYYFASILTHHVMESMETYPDLEYFHTIGFPAENNFLRQLSLMKNLRRLKLVSASLTDEDLFVIALSAPQLRELSICQNIKITISGLKRVARRFSHLVYLYVNDTEAEADVMGLTRVVRLYRRLRRLRVSEKYVKSYQTAMQAKNHSCQVVAV